MKIPAFLTWYFRQHHKANAKRVSVHLAKYQSQWVFAQFFIIYPMIVGWVAKSIIGIFDPSGDLGNFVFLGIWGVIILYLIMCWIVTFLKGPNWAYRNK